MKLKDRHSASFRQVNAQSESIVGHLSLQLKSNKPSRLQMVPFGGFGTAKVVSFRQAGVGRVVLAGKKAPVDELCGPGVTTG